MGLMKGTLDAGTLTRLMPGSTTTLFAGSAMQTKRVIQLALTVRGSLPLVGSPALVQLFGAARAIAGSFDTVPYGTFLVGTPGGVGQRTVSIVPENVPLIVPEATSVPSK